MLDLIPHESLPEELLMFRSSIRRFVDKELVPLEHALGADGLLDEVQAQAVRDRARAAGFWLMDVPEALGGQGLSLLPLAVFWEEVGRSTVASWVRHHGLFGPTVGPILAGLSEHQRKDYLYPVVDGAKKFCFAQTEPDAGSDPSAMRTRAVRTEKGYRINGVKRFITRAGQADFALVMAVTDPERGARGGISCFIVDMQTPGVRLAGAERTLMGDRPWEIAFEDVDVPAENLVGEEGRGFALAQGYINHGRIRQGAHACGAAERCLGLTATYAGQRKTFGAPLSERQGVQWMLADGFTEVYATRLLVYDAARKADAGMDAKLETFMIKTFGVEMGFRVVDACLQMHGGMGLTEDSPIERFWRDLRSYRITEGPTEVLRTTLARQILKHFQ
ncbi:acyl-CoA dehydrogenase family protein [Bordetella avium]|uniref:Medium-chain specific acyl-CoA dehydrogenase, mitochondrial n=1 Tax=Bordetella avium (strain 197N) TaxID=360910 RepID=Q2KXS4_BORA1|nr:acyl-CoA dehydrogenase family protein [Bordetella avium]AZY48166.1 acyl-CoA dehydrogenase [Bordetella avium]RIQ14600.1 acyl-CoA dehydrogenase [Bordetella avium]RIQ16710.1 acyl-CoA dehydrogenase [Bordetella avium]RIQ35044.1 acyl-CoA dehydrogenase [Bordetella avium]RIQ40946.1 acyl-CoA dehydrogenase [Bordetella avium]